MDFASVGGILLALIGILGGLMLEGGSLAQVTRPTALLIVLGGTLGAVMLQFPLNVFLAALQQFTGAFLSPRRETGTLVDQIVFFAVKARRACISALDSELESIQDPFLKQALMLAVDGVEPAVLRQIMQLELENKAEFEERIPQVFEAAGGFAPTVGIIGAVIGLIQVMQRLDNMAEVGRGIATAFVATIYGVGLANLIFLPVAGKLRIRHQEDQLIQHMLLEGVTSIQEGMNPRMIELKLKTYLFNGRQEKEKQQAAIEVASEA